MGNLYVQTEGGGNTFTPPISDLLPMAEHADLRARLRLSSFVMKQIRLFSALLWIE